ncbi:MAG TPA: DUF3772 domain-containing protein, partial [Paracoccaceae bacterium]|nr:DUF3772 domain-containing protein [Paracoccaceae bacterium]
MTRLLLPLLALLLVARLAAAQGGADLSGQTEQWERAAAQAEAQVANPDVSGATLELVRAEMVEQRAEAQAAREQAQERVKPLRVQLEALGPTPAEGAVEAPEIAEQRRRLNETLAAAEVPVKAAETAYRRADAVIAQIDSIQRTRFRDELLVQRSTPLNPAHWLSLLTEVSERATNATADAMVGVSRAGNAIWPALAAGAAGLFLLAIIRTRVMKWFGRQLAPNLGSDGTERLEVWASGGLTIAALLIPAIGCALILFALRQSGMANGSAAPYLRDLLPFAVALVVAYWLSQTLFGVDVPARDMFPMRPRKARRAGRMTLILGLVVGLDRVLVAGSSAVWMSLEALAVYNFILIAIGAFALWRLGVAMAPEAREKGAVEADGEEAGEASAGAGIGEVMRDYLARAARIIAIVAPVLSLLGFYAASRFAFYPFVMTGALFGAWLVIVALVYDGIEAAVARKAEGGDGRSPLRLLPVLVGFVLGCMAIPVLALIWGARESDIDEAGRLLTEGISLGETRVSPLDFVTFALIFVAGYTLTRLAQSILRGSVLPQTSLDSGGRMAVVSMVGYVGIVLAALAAVGATGLDLSNLAIVAGALSVGVGFGLQNVVSNFVSGLILLVERPVKEGDWIKVGDFEGIVKRISVRATSVQTFDRAVVVVPNADLISTPVLNRTHTSTTGRIV